jgi:hypothetical protein
MRMGTCDACGQAGKLLEAQAYIDGLKSDLCDVCRGKLCICERCSAWSAGRCQAERPCIGCYSYSDPNGIFPTIGASEGCRDTWEQREDWTREEVDEWLA